VALFGGLAAMRLSGLRELIVEAYGAGAVDGSTPLLVLVRNPEAPIDSDDAWSRSPVVDMRVDPDGGDLDLITEASAIESRLTLIGISVTLAELPSECDEYPVFVRGEHGGDGSAQDEFIDSPVVGSALDSEQRNLGVIVEFDGYDETLG